MAVDPYQTYKEIFCSRCENDACRDMLKESEHPIYLFKHREIISDCMSLREKIAEMFKVEYEPTDYLRGGKWGARE